MSERPTIDQRIVVFSPTDAKLIIPRPTEHGRKKLFHNPNAPINSEIVARRFLETYFALASASFKAIASYGRSNDNGSSNIQGFGLEPDSSLYTIRSSRDRNFGLEILDMDDALLELLKNSQPDRALFDEHDSRFIVDSFRHIPRYRQRRKPVDLPQ